MEDRRSKEDNIKMHHQEVGCEGKDWIDFAQGRDRWVAFVHAVMKLRVPYNMGNVLTRCESISF